MRQSGSVIGSDQEVPTVEEIVVTAIMAKDTETGGGQSWWRAAVDWVQGRIRALDSWLADGPPDYDSDGDQDMTDRAEHFERLAEQRLFQENDPLMEQVYQQTADIYQMIGRYLDYIEGDYTNTYGGEGDIPLTTWANPHQPSADIFVA